MGTFRIVCIVKNKKLLATVLAFVEALIWFLVIREVLTMENNMIIIPIFYAGGFATGTYIGLILSDMFISGYFTVNAISNKINDADILKIKQAGFGVSFFPMGDKKIFLIIQIDKKRFEDIKSILRALDDKVFIMVNETRHVYHGFIK